MGMGVPLLNEYKRRFLLKRIPQTILGGLKLRVGYDAPAYVYFHQIVLWLVPFLLGCVFTLVLELAYTDAQVYDFLLLYCCLYGACIVIFVVVVQTISTVVQMKEKENQLSGVIQKKNILSDEDEVDFETCCGAETLGFVIPPKKFKVNIAVHALLSGLICGMGFWYLLPYSVNELYGHSYGVTAAIFILGWLTVCVAQYSLTCGAPPEPAIYRTMDTYELLPLTRPLYAFICYSIHIADWYSSGVLLANQILHVVFVLLPVLWLCGLLPPAEVLVLGLLEQGQVFLLGGTPYASWARLIVGFLLSSAVFVGCYFLTSTFSSVVLAACAGYLLSTDLGALGSQIWAACQRTNNNRVSSARHSTARALNAPQPTVTGFLWSWCWSTVVYHAAMTAVVGGVAAAVNYHADSLSSDVVRYLGYVVIAACVVEKVMRDSQSVYVLFGLWRNALYPQTSESSRLFHNGKRKLLVVGVFRRILLNWVSPLLMVVYLSLRVKAADVMSDSLISGRSTVLGVFYVFGVVRAFRWSWQSTTHALLETSVVHILLVTLSDSTLVTSDLSAPTLLLIASVARDRFYQLLNKLYLALALAVTSWTDRKQRRGSTMPLIALNLVFLPVLLAVVAMASALSAPLLCLFTLPLYFIGYPRLSRFWPEPVGSSANTCPDSLYYRQLSLELAKALRQAFANGSLGEPQVGNHYLMRFQDRLVWTMILERGAGYCSVSVKGLELQETSCHTAEAARIDDQFKEAFERPADDVGVCTFNSYPLHSLTPLDTAEVKAYSDARNILTGVIDSPDAVDVTLTFFAKSLVWLLLHHINRRKRQEEESRKQKEQELARMEEFGKNSSGKDSMGGDWMKMKMKNKERQLPALRSSATAAAPLPEINHNVMTPAAAKAIRGVGGGDSFVLPPINGNKTSLVQGPRPPSRDSNPSRKGSVTSSLHSFTDSIWSDDDFDRGRKAGPTRRQHKVATVVSVGGGGGGGGSSPLPQPVMTSLPPLLPGKKSSSAFNDSGTGKDIDDFLTDMDFGLPAVDVNTTHTVPDFDDDGPSSKPQPLAGRKPPPPVFAPKPSTRFAAVTNGNHIYRPVMNLAGSPDFKCQSSSYMSVPSKWRELPIEPSQLSRYMSQFPVSWYKHTLTTLDWSLTGQPGATVALEVGADEALTNCYSQLVMACYSAFDTPGRPSGPSYLHKCYCGEVPWNAMMDWLSEDRELHTLVITAFRYGFKLMLDQMLLGEISDHEELEETLRGFDNHWYIGRETEAGWATALAQCRENLFSLGHNLGQGTYSSRSLSLQDLMVHMGRVNAEAVRGQWANLSLELLYMTNDDEERYSIQAQPAMLRNLTVQAADPPLGYPIYSSPPISVPLL
ncbi:pecanex-like protein 4 [Aplysia californica]|uniref:Pecanex-like protein n=1 Tax=Aplysia californica TaxID=6500 RepID=A0ABM1A2V5_APLCA|nr:pecanex-like protein 4 [Aplysia californica]